MRRHPLIAAPLELLYKVWSGSAAVAVAVAAVAAAVAAVVEGSLAAFEAGIVATSGRRGASLVVPSGVSYSLVLVFLVMMEMYVFKCNGKNEEGR